MPGLHSDSKVQRRNYSALLLSLGIVTVTTVGCESFSWTSRETGALAGTALGAGLGAIVGNQVGNTGAGVAIGSAFGAVSGALVGESVRQSESDLGSSTQRLEEQERRLKENSRIIQELRKGGTDVQESDRGIVVNLPDVLFDFNSSSLRDSSSGTVEDIAHVLSDVPTRRISIEGHTDSLGTFDYNQRLSQQRAQTVARTLEGGGISPARMSVRGFGESRPLATNATVAGRQRNRRVEVVIEN